MLSETSPLVQSSNDNDDLKRKDTTEKSEPSTGIANSTIFALALTVFVQSYLLEGVFPYAGFLTLHVLSSQPKEEEDPEGAVVVVNEETVGTYAGYVACSFMVGRTLTAVGWGRLADSYGRVFVLQASLLASGMTSLGFGLATTYRAALVWRFLMGVGNGITGTIKCLLSEIHESSSSSSTSRSQARETQTMAIVYGMRGYGFLLCPAMTGYLSDPMKQYPRTMRAWTRPWMQSLLLKYPFVLPNLLAGFLCWGAYVSIRDFVGETLPQEKRQEVSLWSAILWCRRKLLRFTGIADPESSSNNDEALSILPVGNNEKIETREKDDESHELSSVATPTVTNDLLWSRGGSDQNETSTYDREQSLQKIRGRWLHLYVYWMFSFLNIASDELFPLFCLSKLSGLGFVEHQISFVLGGTTLVYGLLQYWLLTGLVERLGLYPTLRIGVFGSVPLSIVIPVGSLWLAATATTARNPNIALDHGSVDEEDNQRTLTPWMAVYLCTSIAVIKAFCSVTFSTLTMATNRTVDTIDQRATLNGVASLGGSFAKACGPVFAGTLFSFLAGNPSVAKAMAPPYGSIVAYGILSTLGLWLGFQTLFLRGIHTRR